MSYIGNPGGGASSGGTIIGNGVLTALTVTDYVTTFTPATTPVANTVIEFIPNVNSVDDSTINLSLIKKVTPGGLVNIQDNDLLGGAVYTMLYNGTEWIMEEDSETQDIEQWRQNTVYLRGMLVTKGNLLLRRNADGTSLSPWSLTELNRWSVVSFYGTIDTWYPDSVYARGEKVYDPNNGSILYRINNGTSESSFSNTEAATWSLVSQSFLTAFSPNTYYRAGTQITENGAIYQRNSDGVSGASFNVDFTSWTSPIANYTDMPFWQPNTFYPIGTLLRDPDGFDSFIMRAIYSTVSGSSFDNTERVNFALVSQTRITNWAANTYYWRNFLVSASSVVDADDEVYLSRFMPGISGSTFDTTERLGWRVLSQNISSQPYAGGYFYFVGYIARQGTSRLVRCTTDHTGASTFTNAEAANWNLYSQLEILPFVGTQYYFQGERISVQGKVLQRITAGISAATFTNVEAANWILISQTNFNTWSVIKYYYLGEKVLFGTRTLQSLSTRISLGAFDATEAANWTLIAQSRPSNWIASTYYFDGELVYLNNSLYSKNGNGTSSATLNTAELSGWTRITPTKIQTGTATTTLTEAGLTFVGGTLTANIILTLPTAVGRDGQIMEFKKTDATAFTITIDGATTETIDGALTQVMSVQFDSYTIRSDGANWVVIAKISPATTSSTVTTITSNTTYATWGRTVYVNASGGDVTLTLPTAVAHAGESFEVKKIDTSDNYVFISANGSETIDGGATYVLSQFNDSVLLESNGSNTKVIAVDTPLAKVQNVPTNGTTNLINTARMITLSGTAAQVINLPDCASVPNMSFIIKKLNSPSISSTITATVGTIDGGTSLLLNNTNDTVIIKSTGIAYLVVNYYSAAPTDTAVSGTYTVLESDTTLVVNSGSAFTITIPANRINKLLNIQCLMSSNTITIATSGGETIINPLTATAGASTTLPGASATYTFLALQKTGTVWNVK
jgi:hypothetical protein